MITTIGFIGLGLIGGSIAKALKKADKSYRIIAFNRSRAPLLAAESEGVIDAIAEDTDEIFSDCDFIFLCTPVEYNSYYLKKIAGIIKKDCIITDVGSVKGFIHKTVEEIGLEKNFIGGHPMAGSEKTGYAASCDTLLQNAYYAITPTDSTDSRMLDRYVELIRLTGAIPIVTSYSTHDYAVAGISHVPHIIASSLVNLVHDNDTPDELMKTLAAGGFKDITRIASSSAEMWSQICATNKEQISVILQKYIDCLNNVKDMIDNDKKDDIFNMFVDSKEYRDSINIKKGPLHKHFELYCDIEDKEGALSSITLLLSNNHINIKNIEIIHNREFADGVLLIAFYDENSYKQALNLLTKENYIIHR